MTKIITCIAAVLLLSGCAQKEPPKMVGYGYSEKTSVQKEKIAFAYKPIDKANYRYALLEDGANSYYNKDIESEILSSFDRDMVLLLEKKGYEFVGVFTHTNEMSDAQKRKIDAWVSIEPRSIFGMNTLHVEDSDTKYYSQNEFVLKSAKIKIRLAAPISKINYKTIEIKVDDEQTKAQNWMYEDEPKRLQKKKKSGLLAKIKGEPKSKYPITNANEAFERLLIETYYQSLYEIDKVLSDETMKKLRFSIDEAKGMQ